MQTEKSQSECKRIMPKTRFTEFPALSVHPRVGISRLRQRPTIDYFSYLLLNKIVSIPLRFYNLRSMASNSERHSEFFVTAHQCCKQLTSVLASLVSFLSPWVRQNFPPPLKIEQTLSHRQESNMDSNSVSLIRLSVSDGHKTCSSMGVSVIGI